MYVYKVAEAVWGYFDYDDVICCEIGCGEGWQVGLAYGDVTVSQRVAEDLAVHRSILGRRAAI